MNPEAGYRQAAALFQQWLAQGTLRQEGEPCFYLMRHAYQHRGAAMAQLGLFGNVLVEDYGSGSVLPHEFTREPAVLDRVALLEASKTQFSPLMTLYRDAEGELAPLFEPVMAGPPEVATPARPGKQYRRRGPLAHCRRRLTAAHYPGSLPGVRYSWPTATTATRRPSATAAPKSIRPAAGPAAAHNYVMMSLTEFDDPGLQLLPYHKVIGGLSGAQLAGLQERLGQFFAAEPVNLAHCGGAAGLAQLVIDRGGAGLTIGVVGDLVGGGGERRGWPRRLSTGQPADAAGRD